MASSFFPRGTVVRRADFGSGSGGVAHAENRMPGELTKGVGEVGYLLLHKHEKEKAKIYFDVYKRELPFYTFAPAHVVAKLEAEELTHPKIDAVHKELAFFLNQSFQSATTALKAAIFHEIVSRESSDEKDVIFLDPTQRQQIRDVERKLSELHRDIARDLDLLTQIKNSSFLKSPDFTGPDK